MKKQQSIALFICNLIVLYIGGSLLPLLPLYATELGAEPAVTGNYLDRGRWGGGGTTAQSLARPPFRPLQSLPVAGARLCQQSTFDGSDGASNISG
ncbi:MAG: hypothetical protein M3220_12220, partial [Chloroflexota bacterium]|nr:hypothetical protein [Chloroflexota bacterium]